MSRSPSTSVRRGARNDRSSASTPSSQTRTWTVSASAVTSARSSDPRRVREQAAGDAESARSLHVRGHVVEERRPFRRDAGLTQRRLEDGRVGLKADQGAVRVGGFAFLFVFDPALLERSFDKFSLAKAADEEVLGKCINGFGADTV